jgi:hypothetical protein
MRLRTMAACAVLIPLAAASVNTQEQPAPQRPVPFESPKAVKQELVTTRIQGFNIVLVLGEMQSAGPAPAETLPAGAQKALADMREFLPYKDYRVLDAQWISCCSGTATLSGRLRGVIGIPGPNEAVRVVHRVFDFSLQVGASIHNLPVRFVLRLDSPAGADVARVEARGRQALISDLERSLAALDSQEAELANRYGTSHPERLKVNAERARLRGQLAELTDESRSHQASPGSGALIDSSFSMDAGETVVVGTSRLGGDKALIALVTAVRRTGGKG